VFPFISSLLEWDGGILIFILGKNMQDKYITSLIMK